MAKASKPGPQESGKNSTPSDVKQPVEKAEQAAAPSTVSERKSKPGGKSNSKTNFGGTALQGAKSTQPKEVSNATPSNQQPEYYNRETRRRMQQMRTGPYSDRPAIDPRDRRKKRQERIQERREQIKHTVDAKGPSRDVKLGRRNTYFLIGVFVLVIILIVVFLLLKHPF